MASAAEDFNAPLIQTADTVAEDAKKDDAKVVSGPPAPDAADRAALWAMAKAVAQSLPTIVAKLMDVAQDPQPALKEAACDALKQCLR